MRETKFWRRQVGEGWMALEQRQPLSQNNQDAHLEAYPRSVDFLVDLLKYCKFTSRRLFSKYKPSTKKKDTVHKLDCWRFFDFVIGAWMLRQGTVWKRDRIGYDSKWQRNMVMNFQ